MCGNKVKVGERKGKTKKGLDDGHCSSKTNMKRKRKKEEESCRNQWKLVDVFFTYGGVAIKVLYQ